MASFNFNFGMSKVDNETIKLSTDTIKVMLVNNSYTPTKDDDYVDLGGSTGIAAAEINVTNYTPGYGSASRKSLANKSFSVDDANDRAVFDNTQDLVWSNLGSGATIVAAVLIREFTADTDSIPLSYLELVSPVTTNGGNFTLQFNANGVFYRQQ